MLSRGGGVVLLSNMVELRARFMIQASCNWGEKHR